MARRVELQPLTKIEDKVLQPYRTGREALKNMVEKFKGDPEHLHQALNKKSALLISLDSTIVLELALVESLNQGGALPQLQDQLLQCLPAVGGDGAYTLQGCAAAMQQLLQSNLVLVAGQSGKRLVEGAIDLLVSLAKGICPNTAAMQQDEFLQQLLNRLQYFMQATVHKNDKDVRVHGKAAYFAHALSCKQKLDNQTLTFEDMVPLQGFKFLILMQPKVSDQENKLLADVDTMVKTLTSQLKGLKRPKEQEGSKDKRSKLEVKTMSQGVLSLFA